MARLVFFVSAIVVVCSILIFNPTKHKPGTDLLRDDSIIIRTDDDYRRANVSAARFSSEAFKKIDQGDALTPADIKNLRQATRLYNAMSLFQPTNPAPDFTCGLSLAALGLHEEAIHKFNQFIEMIGPTPKEDRLRIMEADAHGRIAASLNATHKYDEAVIEANRALDMYPRTAAYLVERGSAELKLGDEKKAKADLDEAIKDVDPTDPAMARAIDLEKQLTSKS